MAKRTKHHVIPKSRKGGGGANIVRLDRRFHDVLHSVFDNRTPSEYVDYLNEEPETAAARLVQAIARNFGAVFVAEALRGRKAS